MVFLARQHLLGKKKSSEHEKQTHKQRGTVHFSLFWFGFSFFFYLFCFGLVILLLFWILNDRWPGLPVQSCFKHINVCSD